MATSLDKPISELIEDNTAEFFLYLGRLNGSEVGDYPDVKYVLAGRGFNRIMRARLPVTGADQVIGQLVSWLDTLGIDATWYLRQDSPAESSGAMSRYGFIYRNEWKSMALDLASFSDHCTLPARLEIRRATSSDDLGAWAKVVVSSFWADNPAYNAYARHLTAAGPADDSKCNYYLGLMDGKPVASAALFKGSTVAGIYWVGTLPEARGNGIATSMMRQALRDARACGYTLATLNASAAGHPIYLKMGFKDYFTTGIYHRLSSSN